jgi:hypothetical protein
MLNTIGKFGPNSLSHFAVSEKPHKIWVRHWNSSPMGDSRANPDVLPPIRTTHTRLSRI